MATPTDWVEHLNGHCQNSLIMDLGQISRRNGILHRYVRIRHGRDLPRIHRPFNFGPSMDARWCTPDRSFMPIVPRMIGLAERGVPGSHPKPVWRQRWVFAPVPPTADLTSASFFYMNDNFSNCHQPSVLVRSSENQCREKAQGPGLLER